VCWIVLIGQYLIWRKFGRTAPKAVSRAEIVLVALVGVLGLSVVTHDWRFGGALPASRLLFYYLMPLGIYWVASRTTATKRAALTVFALFGLFGVYLAVTAVAETRGLWWLVYPKYIASPDFVEFYGRGRGPLLNPIGVGFFMSVCLAGLLMWWPWSDRPGKVGLLGMATLLFAGIYATMTRSVWMGASVAAGSVVLLATPRRWRMPLAAAGLLIVVALGTTQWERFVAFRRDRGLSAQETADSIQLRPILARVAWNMFLDRPIWGCGFGQYQRECVYYLNDRTTELPLQRARPYIQHNAFLALLTETGLVGLGLFVLLLGFWTRDAWRLWRWRAAPLWARQQGLVMLATLAAYLPNAMFHDVAVIPMFHMLLFFQAGWTTAMGPSAHTVSTRRRSPRGQERHLPDAGARELAPVPSLEFTPRESP
jgi:O-antigen ligase